MHSSDQARWSYKEVISPLAVHTHIPLWYFIERHDGIVYKSMMRQRPTYRTRIYEIEGRIKPHHLGHAKAAEEGLLYARDSVPAVQGP